MSGASNQFDKSAVPADNEIPMEVTLALLADAANVTESGKLNVLGAFDTVFSDQFPYQHPQMYCVVRLSAGPAEFGKEKKLEISVVDPDGKVLGMLRGTATVPDPGSGRRASVEIMLRMGNVPFKEPGDYAVVVLVGGEEKWSIPLQVVKREVRPDAEDS
jgi:hypothetical protein